ncbi:hypothetical protein ACI7RC_10685 [Brevibacillus sp. B_LB10_24]|uniref:hypothetical protein n=1 Tax=Brevibacillus sp. B_LB10_24 TaxID=3380645 RepID=UPI0038B844B4
MRYFTAELWEQFNSENDKEREEASKKWDKNCEEYFSRLALNKNRFSKEVYDFFSSNTFHGFRVVSVTILNDYFGNLYPVNVEINLTNHREEWTIRYLNVNEIQLCYKSGESDVSKTRGFDEWGYDELLDVDDTKMSHEILFASGASLRIEFENQMISLEKK